MTIRKKMIKKIQAGELSFFEFSVRQVMFQGMYKLTNEQRLEFYQRRLAIFNQMNG